MRITIAYALLITKDDKHKRIDTVRSFIPY